MNSLPYQSCIDACIKCASACDHCAASCLLEKDVSMMSRCIQLDMECSSVCKTTVQLMHLQSNHANAVCQLCADICNACAEECEKHDHEHCRSCAAMCRECAEECMSMAAA
jgi:vacuolar-type H+-ATPase catalytic subunit A/Vma1